MSGLTFPRVVRAEWTKLVSLRSVWLVTGCASLVTVAVAGLVGWATGRPGAAPTTPTAAVGAGLFGVDLISLVFGVFGVVLMTGEYGSGTIRATLTAVPRRIPVLAAKAVTLIALTAPVMVVVCSLSYLVDEAFLPAGLRLGPDHAVVVRTVLGASAATVATALIGLALGAIIRHTAGAITGYVLGMLVLPALLPALLPASARDHVLAYVPVAAGQALYAVGEDGNPVRMLAPGPAALVLLAWIAAMLAAGATVLYRRDA